MRPADDTDALRATARSIAADDVPGGHLGEQPIPPDEVIAEVNPSLYEPPRHLRRTGTPELADEFADLLDALRDLNAGFAGEPTLEVQAYLSFTGEHERLEDAFLNWSGRYFGLRTDMGLHGPGSGNDPWRLYERCEREFDDLIGRRLRQPGTANSCVLNLSQRWFEGVVPYRLFRPELATAVRPDRFGCDAHRTWAARLAGRYEVAIETFTDFLGKLGGHLPPGYAPDGRPEWVEDVRAAVRSRAEDLHAVRPLLCVVPFAAETVRRVCPDLWVGFDWTVYPGGVIADLTTSGSAESWSRRVTGHPIGLHRTGWLCQREYPWLRVDPGGRAAALAVNHYLLDQLHDTLLRVWDRLDKSAIRDRGVAADASPVEQAAAVAATVVVEVASAEHEPRKPARRLRVMRLSEVERVLARLGVECRPGPGSERVAYAPGGRHFRFGRHGRDVEVHPRTLGRCLSRLGIPDAAWVAECGR